jgi:hypothetical protein
MDFLSSQYREQLYSSNYKLKAEGNFSHQGGNFTVTQDQKQWRMHAKENEEKSW